DEQDAAIKAIEECDILTTSVWADNLPKIAAVVAKGLKQRLVSGQPKINVLACENALFASDRLRREVVNTGIITDAELHQVSNFVNTSVD
ncbi:mannitol dehydrogenase, partial [Klebsiella pneumoniae]|nr:mannitol dehydrogenase [Klebsiella pneumoniae]